MNRTRIDWRYSHLRPLNRYFKTLLCLCVFFLVSCSSNKGISYQGKQSDPKVMSHIANQYQNWKSTPYRYGGTSHKGIDCSGLVVHTFQSKFKMNLPRTTREQAKMGYEVSKLKAGDLVFFKTGRGENGLHVGIYYKEGQFLHVSTRRGVELARLDSQYWKSNYWMSRRIL